MGDEIEAALQGGGADDEIDPAALLLIHPSDVPVPSADASHAESAELLLPGPPPLQAEESLSGGEMLAPTVVLDEPPPSMPPSPPPSVISGTVDLTHIPPEHLAMLCSNPSENACACDLNFMTQLLARNQTSRHTHRAVKGPHTHARWPRQSSRGVIRCRV